MKNNIDKQEIEQLEKFFDEKYEHFEMTPEQWRFMEAARKRGLKKLMLSMGFSGFLIYYSGVIKGFLIKLATTKMVVAAVAGTAVVSAATVAVVKYAQLAGVDEKDKVKEDVVKEVVVDETDSPDVLKKENIEQKKKDTRLKPVYKPNVGIILFEGMGEQKALSDQITREIVKNLPGKKFRLIKKAEDGKGYINTLVTGSVVKTGNKYIVSVKARDLDFTVILNKKYSFSDLKEIKKISKKIAGELSHAGF